MKVQRRNGAVTHHPAARKSCVCPGIARDSPGRPVTSRWRNDLWLYTLYWTWLYEFTVSEPGTPSEYCTTGCFLIIPYAGPPGVSRYGYSQKYNLTHERACEWKTNRSRGALQNTPGPAPQMWDLCFKGRRSCFILTTTRGRVQSYNFRFTFPDWTSWDACITSTTIQCQHCLVPHF